MTPAPIAPGLEGSGLIARHPPGGAYDMGVLAIATNPVIPEEERTMRRVACLTDGCILLRLPFGFSGFGTVNAAGQLRVQSGVQRSELRYTQLRIALPIGVLRNEHGSQDRYASR